jgi:hypothetical protein
MFNFKIFFVIISYYTAATAGIQELTGINLTILHDTVSRAWVFVYIRFKCLIHMYFVFTEWIIICLI